jgi:hypothetical protein
LFYASPKRERLLSPNVYPTKLNQIAMLSEIAGVFRVSIKAGLAYPGEIAIITDFLRRFLVLSRRSLKDHVWIGK